MKRIGAAQFKATCLRVIDRVAMTGEPVEVTKRGKPVARLVPVQGSEEAPPSIFGASAHRILYLAEAQELLSTGEAWDAER